jgi:restriction endonuclease
VSEIGDMATVPNEYDLARAKLPRLAYVAFAARCVRRVQPWVDALWPIEPPSDYTNAVEHAARFVEISATTGQIDTVVGIRITADAEKNGAAAADSPYTYYGAQYVPKTMASAVAAALAARTESDWAVAVAAADTAKFAMYAVESIDPDDRMAEYPTERVEALTTAIRNDFELLCTSSAKYGWSHFTSVPPEFFSHHSEFDLRPPLIAIPSLIDESVIRKLSLDPKLLYDLSGRQFEELIAKVFEKFGFMVELTQQTRDNGCDIIAIRHGYGKAKYLIECKKYAAENRVGIAVAQRLLGVVMSEGATKGILATTSWFTNPAKKVIDTTWWLEGRDFEGITRWLNNYQTFSMYKDLGLDTSFL